MAVAHSLNVRIIDLDDLKEAFSLDVFSGGDNLFSLVRSSDFVRVDGDLYSLNGGGFLNRQERTATIGLILNGHHVQLSLENTL